jgi:hypothetical protein
MPLMNVSPIPKTAPFAEEEIELLNRVLAPRPSVSGSRGSSPGWRHRPPHRSRPRPPLRPSHSPSSTQQSPGIRKSSLPTLAKRAAGSEPPNLGWRRRTQRPLFVQATKRGRQHGAARTAWIPHVAWHTLFVRCSFDWTDRDPAVAATATKPWSRALKPPMAAADSWSCCWDRVM